MVVCAAKDVDHESALVEACRAGDREAFRALFELYKNRVYSIALHHLGGNEAAARDTVQQVFVRLFSTISQFRGNCEFSTWLYRIVFNTAMDRRRSERREAPLDDARQRPSGGSSHDDEFARRELAGSVQSAIRSLTADLRWPILLRYFEGLSYKEIGAVLRCSEGTVASRLNRGHKLLAAKLAHLRGGLGRGK